MSVDLPRTTRPSLAPGAASRPVDPRGLRFAAAVTALVLGAALVTDNGWLVAGQAVVFAAGALGRPPYGVLFQRLVRPLIGPPSHLEDSRPPRFAQLVGLGCTAVAVLGFVAGSSTLAITATAAALVAALLNAAFGLCLGCELYLFVRRSAPFRKPYKEVSL